MGQGRFPKRKGHLDSYLKCVEESARPREGVERRLEVGNRVILIGARLCIILSVSNILGSLKKWLISGWAGEGQVSLEPLTLPESKKNSKRDEDTSLKWVPLAKLGAI